MTGAGQVMTGHDIDKSWQVRTCPDKPCRVITSRVMSYKSWPDLSWLACLVTSHISGNDMWWLVMTSHDTSWLVMTAWLFVLHLSWHIISDLNKDDYDLWSGWHTFHIFQIPVSTKYRYKRWERRDMGTAVWGYRVERVKIICYKWATSNLYVCSLSLSCAFSL